MADPEAQNALWRARCDDVEWATWILPADYFKLRTVSLTYQMPDELAPRVSAASLIVAANNQGSVRSPGPTDPPAALSEARRAAGTGRIGLRPRAETS